MQLSQEVAPGVAWLRTVMVNVVFVEPEPHDGRWVLVDAGLAGHHRVIARAARARFGNRPPAAIILTHAHFDHVGSLERLLDRLGDITIDESMHGPADSRRYEWEPTFLLRRLKALHIEFTPIEEST